VSAQVTGRFAPTPSGPLHLGSLVTALASYCEARSKQGKWLVRMEDLDTPRVVKGAADHILATLEAFGFEWDDEVLYQSHRFEVYQAGIQKLIHDGHIYACKCTRKSLKAQNVEYGPLGMIYPGFCRDKKLDVSENLSLRLNLQHAGVISFDDSHCGSYALNLPRQVGDIVIKRIDGIYAYHLAVVMDDAFQQVDHIVRGEDLLPVTPLHLYLNRLLDYPDACYLHLPLIKTINGKKLSKQTGARAIEASRANEQLIFALKFLGQVIDPEIERGNPSEIVKYAVKNWDSKAIPVFKPDTDLTA
jgi:glutamyl-Q tRNA(Asp) synthetase